MKNKFERTMPPAPGITFLDRINHSISVLYVHGFLTDAEKNRVRARLNKEIAKEQTK